MTNSFPINPLVLDTVPPAILEARAWLESYDGSKGAPIDLSQAAPPYSPPQELLNRLSAAAGAAETSRYGPVQGEPNLRAAYAKHISEFYQDNISPACVTITGGCNQAFVIATMLVAQSGDAVILPVPWYFNHKMTLDMLGIEARLLPCLPSHSFVPNKSDIERLIDAKVRALVLVSPNNPTGAIYPRETIEAIAALCRKRNVWLIIDETYRDFLPDESRKPHGLFGEEFRDGVIALYSFSKSLAIPGHRLGAMVYPTTLAQHALKVQDCVQICPARAGQIAIAWGLTHLQDWRSARTREIAERANAFQSKMAAIGGWKVDSIGAYFAYIRHPFDGPTATQIASRLASENGILLIPGSFFGPNQNQHLRLSLGNLDETSLSNLTERLQLA